MHFFDFALTSFGVARWTAEVGVNKSMTVDLVVPIRWRSDCHDVVGRCVRIKEDE